MYRIIVKTIRELKKKIVCSTCKAVKGLAFFFVLDARRTWVKNLLKPHPKYSGYAPLVQESTCKHHTETQLTQIKLSIKQKLNLTSAFCLSCSNYFTTCCWQIQMTFTIFFVEKMEYIFLLVGKRNTGAWAKSLHSG